MHNTIFNLGHTYQNYFTSSDLHHDISKQPRLDFMSAWSGQVKVDI